MSILASLVKAYDRFHTQGKLPPFGYARIEAQFCIVLRADGSVAFDPVDLRLPSGKKLRAPKLALPAPLTQRTSDVKPNFLWDKTSYCLGITSNTSARTKIENGEFIAFHESVLRGCKDEGLDAFLNFLRKWNENQFTALNWDREILDANIVFALEHEYRQRFLHQRSAARDIWDRVLAQSSVTHAVCLVTGVEGRIADSHPPIKGVDNAQSSGAFIVSFNDDAYRSYGHMSGDNAPVSEIAAFAYTTVLNRFLERDSGHRIQIADVSTVFWAEADDLEAIEIAEAWGAYFLGDDGETKVDEVKLADEQQARKEIESKLKRLVKGAALKDVEPKLAAGVKFYVLGLSPNAARIAVRFFWEGNFGELANNYRDYMRDIMFQPWPADKQQPTIKQCALRLSPARIDVSGKLKFDSKQIPKSFSAEYFRSIITGDRFPGSVLGQLLLRIRSDHLLDPTRVAMIKAILVRSMRLDGRLPKDSAGNEDKDYLMHPDPEDPNTARRLGRLFAIMERIQSASLGEKVNATIKDKYFGGAAATPAQVFNSLLNLIEHHLSRLRRGHSDAEWVEKAAKKFGIGKSEMAQRLHSRFSRDMGKLTASFYETGFPAQHDRDEQGFFLIGYYQERYGRKAAAGDYGVDVDALALNEPDEE